MSRAFCRWGVERRAFGGERVPRIGGVEGKVWRGRIRGVVTKRRVVTDIAEYGGSDTGGGRRGFGNARCDAGGEQQINIFYLQNSTVMYGNWRCGHSTSYKCQKNLCLSKFLQNLHASSFIPYYHQQINIQTCNKFSSHKFSLNRYAAECTDPTVTRRPAANIPPYVPCPQLKSPPIAQRSSANLSNTRSNRSKMQTSAPSFLLSPNAVPKSPRSVVVVACRK